MNQIIKAVIGEADMHSPTERAVLDREATGATEPHGEADMGNPEESKEVQLAKQILSACQSGDKETVCRSARELLQMHEPQAAGGHVQPVPHPQPPRALDYGPHSGGV